MATLTTHLLSSVDGQHAAGVAIAVVQRTTGSADIVLASGESDHGGRFQADITPANPTDATRYECVLQTARYFAEINPARDDVLEEIVIRFAMPDTTARYHMPLMIAPNNYSVWWSPPGG